MSKAAVNIATPQEGIDQIPSRIQGMFGAIAPSYDRLNHLLSATLDKRWRRQAAQEVLAGLNPCRRVLDIATGTGDLAAELQATFQRLNPQSAIQLQIIGGDFTRPMLQRAAEKYGRADYRWAEADGTRLPFAADSFDAVTVAFGLRNMHDKHAAIAEMARVVRPGGRIAILEFGQPTNPLFSRFYDFYSFQVMPRIGRLISGSDAYLYLARSIRQFLTADALAQALQMIGLKAVRYTTLLGGVVYLHVGTLEA